MVTFCSKLHSNKSAQNLVEFCLLIAVVVASVAGMQTYARRALQARYKTAIDAAAETASEVTGPKVYRQYEPYYREDTYISQHKNLVKESASDAGQGARNLASDRYYRQESDIKFRVGADFEKDDLWDPR